MPKDFRRAAPIRRMDTEDEDPTEIYDLDVQEISLVNKAANGKKFLLFKAARGASSKTFAKERIMKRLDRHIPEGDRFQKEDDGSAEVQYDRKAVLSMLSARS